MNGSGASARLAGLTSEEVTARWHAARAFLGVGTTAVVVGGLVAALTRPANFALGPWVAGYLVLVGGVAQVALGVGQAWLAGEPPSALVRWAELITWNLGSAAIIAGSVVAAPLWTTVGGGCLLPALVLFWRAVGRDGRAASWAVTLYRVLASVVAGGIAVGLVLSWIRHH